MGREIAEQGYGLVYGGASVGLMGVTADAALAGGAPVTGILPRWLDRREIAHTGLTELRVVESMHERKAQMAEMSGAFVVLPGGIGSMEECFEMWTWTQLGIHTKPIGLLNINGYYDRLSAFLDQIVEEGFMRSEHRGMLLSESSASTLLSRLKEFTWPEVKKWL